MIDRGNSLARSVAEERCSPSSPSRTTGSTSVSGGGLGLNGDLSLEEIHPIANE